MKTIFTLVAAVLCHAVIVKAAEIKQGERLKSPDGRFTAELAVTEDYEEGIMVNSSTGKAFPIIPTIGPVLLMKWTGDSKNIASIVHIAGGSRASVYHLKGDSWVPHGVYPMKGDTYEVIGLLPKYDTVEMAYKVVVKSAGDLPEKYYVKKFVYHPDTDERLNEVSEEIDADTYGRLKLSVGGN